MKKLTIIAVCALLVPAVGQAFDDTYTVDLAHAEIGFSVKHLGISNVRGEFADFKAALDYDGENLSSLKGEATIQAASIDTGNKKRDGHLRNADYFDVAKYPEITFKSTGVHAHGDTAHMDGVLTIKGISKKIRLDVTLNGPVDSPFEPGVRIIGFQASTQINRQEFNVGHDGPSDKLIGDTISIEISIEAKK
jgi:polyisoprenoid-binding protein YceI